MFLDRRQTVNIKLTREKTNHWKTVGVKTIQRIMSELAAIFDTREIVECRRNGSGCQYCRLLRPTIDHPRTTQLQTSGDLIGAICRPECWPNSSSRPAAQQTAVRLPLTAWAAVMTLARPPTSKLTLAQRQMSPMLQPIDKIKVSLPGHHRPTRNLATLTYYLLQLIIQSINQSIRMCLKWPK